MPLSLSLFIGMTTVFAVVVPPGLCFLRALLAARQRNVGAADDDAGSGGVRAPGSQLGRELGARRRVPGDVPVHLALSAFLAASAVITIELVNSGAPHVVAFTSFLVGAAIAYRFWLRRLRLSLQPPVLVVAASPGLIEVPATVAHAAARVPVSPHHVVWQRGDAVSVRFGDDRTRPLAALILGTALDTPMLRRLLFGDDLVLTAVESREDFLRALEAASRSS